MPHSSNFHLIKYPSIWLSTIIQLWTISNPFSQNEMKPYFLIFQRFYLFKFFWEKKYWLTHEASKKLGARKIQNKCQKCRKRAGLLRNDYIFELLCCLSSRMLLRIHADAPQKGRDNPAEWRDEQLEGQKTRKGFRKGDKEKGSAAQSSRARCLSCSLRVAKRRTTFRTGCQAPCADQENHPLPEINSSTLARLVTNKLAT